MFARLTVLQFIAARADEGFAIVSDSIVPSIKEQHGFKGLLLLRDASTRSASVLSLWESEGDMDATAAGNFPIQMAKVSALVAGQPSRRVYEVSELSI